MRMVEIDGKYFNPLNILSVYTDEDEGGTILELPGGANENTRHTVPTPLKEVVGRINDAMSG